MHQMCPSCAPHERLCDVPSRRRRDLVPAAVETALNRYAIRHKRRGSASLAPVTLPDSSRFHASSAGADRISSLVQGSQMPDLYLFEMNRPVIHTSADDNQIPHSQLPDDLSKVLCRLKRGAIDL